MNIFIFDYDIKTNVKQYCDRHVVKMITESAQMLCTVLHKNGIPANYKPTHENNELTLWAGKSKANFIYLLELGLAIGNEYTYRYGKIHKSQYILFDIQDKLSKLEFEELELTPFVHNTKEIEHEDTATAYRMYFNKHKQHIAKWKNREIPEWFIKEESMSLLRKLKLNKIVEVVFTDTELKFINFIKNEFSDLKVIRNNDDNGIHYYLKNGINLLKVIEDNKIEIVKYYIKKNLSKRKDSLELLNYLLPEILKEQKLYIENSEFITPDTIPYTQIVRKSPRINITPNIQYINKLKK